jgi:Flp pilus assembly pilin Flp
MLKIREPVGTCISDSFCKSYIWIRESQRGQTLAEYALIFAALSLAVFAAYQAIGNNIVILGNGLNSDLTSA